MIELYEFPPVRSQRVKWALEELGIDYKSLIVDLTKGEQNTDAYRSIHPLGVVPALKTDHYKIFESVAIILQLIDEHPKQSLAPAVGSADRASYYQWCIFACAELDPQLISFYDNTMKPEEFRRPAGTPHDERQAELARDTFGQRADALSSVLKERDHLLPSGFSGADIAIGHSCFMADHMGLLGDFPILEVYYQRLQERPGYQRAYPN